MINHHFRRPPLASLFAAVVIAAMAAGCGERDKAVPRGTKEVQTALDHAVDTGVPGIAVSIRRGKQEEFLTSGSASTEARRPIRPNTRFRIASVTKSFTAAIVMQLASEKKVSLDATVEDVVPGLLGPGGKVTVRELLAHTSGLPDYVKSPAFVERAGAGKRIAPRQALRFIADKELEFEPGSSYAYSDSDNIVLGLIIEKATGRSYEQELRSRVLRPLDLRETSLATSLRFPKPHAQGYQYSEGGRGKPENVTRVPLDPNGAWASGALISTPRDVSRFFGALLGGELVPNTQVRMMKVTVDGAGDPPGPGKNTAGLGIFGWKIVCGEIWGHTGSWPGFRTLGAASDKGRSSLAVVVNATEISDKANQAVLRAQELAACRAMGEAPK